MDRPVPMQAIELHNAAAHAHMKAAASHLENDHLTAHELSKLAMEKSREAHQYSEKLAHEAEFAGLPTG